MKFVLPIFLFLFINSSAQNTQNSSPVLSGKSQLVTSAKTFGYVDGIRLDSIDATYAEFGSRLFRSGVTFNYGQSKEKQKNMVITDRHGRPLDFEPDTISMLLNFFYFNGWELAHVYNSTSGGVDTFILKRK